MGQEFLNIMDPDEVKKIVANIPINKRVEKVSLENSLTRILSEDVKATINLPPFRRVSMDGYTVIMKLLKVLNYPKEKIDNSLKSMNSVTDQLSSLEDCREFYKSILKEVIELRNKNSQKRYVALIEKAREYIHQKFSMSDLTLDKVASTVNVSPNYFSSLFNQESGMTFIEYLTDIRMEKAKDYLRCSGRKITEIGFLVGYQDSHYFSYIFKKTQNCTPSQYRLQGKGEV